MPEDASLTEEMREKLKTAAGQAAYKLMKQVTEPIFGVIKSVLGFRQLSQRGFLNVEAARKLVCIFYNVKKIHKPTAVS
ncbi:MAG: transposase [Deltaproteobacteria bacterium]|nr:transposase [Deltaproteobacteria bacterium]